MHYYNQFQGYKILTLKIFSQKNAANVRRYFEHKNYIILQLHRLIKTKKACGQLKICKYVINKDTLGFYLQCLNYQNFSYITDTELDNEKLSINLHFLCLIYHCYNEKMSIQFNDRKIIETKENKNIFLNQILPDEYRRSRILYIDNYDRKINHYEERKKDSVRKYNNYKQKIQDEEWY